MLTLLPASALSLVPALGLPTHVVFNTHGTNGHGHSGALIPDTSTIPHRPILR